MTIADITLTAFTLCNSLRVVAYVPQIAKAAKDRSGAEAISLGTWALFLVSHASAAAYALVNQNDWTMAWVFLGNAVGCGAILLITVWKRSQHRRRRPEGATPTFQLAQKTSWWDRKWRPGMITSSHPFPPRRVKKLNRETSL